MTSKVMAANVSEALRPYAGARVFFEPLDGNHGDWLIVLGAREVMNPLGFSFVDDPETAELIVINGGGGIFAQPWCGDLARFRRYSQGHRSVPLVVLPSSFFWGEQDFAAAFADRTAPSVVFARERPSLARLEAANLPDDVSIGLDRDLAFHLAGTPLIEEARRVPSEGYLLLVERFDEEQATGKPLRIKRIRGYARHLPVPVQNVLKGMLDRVRRRSSGFENSVLSEALARRPDLSGKPVIYHDVSNVGRNSFEEFVRMIAASDAVVTTRMHAGILAAMLGKPAFLKGKDDSYRKLQSVFEYSLASMPDVYLLGS